MNLNEVIPKTETQQINAKLECEHDGATRIDVYGTHCLQCNKKLSD